MMIALWEARNIEISAIARHFHGKAKEESCFKRIQRFLKKVTLSQNSIAKLVMAILDINIFYLSVVYRNISIPLFFSFLINKKNGTTN